MLVAISPARWTDARLAAPEALALHQAGVAALLLRLDPALPLAPWLDALLPIWGRRLWLHLRCEAALKAVVEQGLHLHLPGSADPRQRRPLARWGLSQSVHDAGSLATAQAAGVDQVLLSPIYAPGSKPGDDRRPLGPLTLGALCSENEVPVLALGGMDTARVAICRRAGAAGAAAIGAFFDQPGAAAVGARARALQAAWDGALGPPDARG